MDVDEQRACAAIAVFSVGGADLILSSLAVAVWQPEDDPETKLDKMETIVAGTGLAPAEVVPLLATLLSLPLPEGRHPPLELSPEQL